MTDDRYHFSSQQLYWVSENVIAHDFPRLELALRDPDGLLAIGGDLSSKRLLDAYRKGIFPWFNLGQPIMWWSPDPRCVLEPEELKISRSLQKTLRNSAYQTTLNHAFEEVIVACAEPRPGSDETWITDDIILAYCNLHHQGYAHSIEVWHEDKLVGGLYGIAIDRVFFGESMFSRMSDTSKIALVKLRDFLQPYEFRLIDCQVYSPHLGTLGAKPVARPLFQSILQNYCEELSPKDWSAQLLA